MTTRHVLNAMRAEAVRKAKDVYFVKPHRIRRAISTKYDKSGGLFTVTGRRMNVADFYMSPKSRPKRRMKGLTIGVKRESGLEHVPRGFIIPGKNSGKMLGFVRVGKAQDDIEALTRPAIPQLMENPDVQEAILERGADDFNKTFYFWVNKAIREGKL